MFVIVCQANSKNIFARLVLVSSRGGGATLFTRFGENQTEPSMGPRRGRGSKSLGQAVRPRYDGGGNGQPPRRPLPPSAGLVRRPAPELCRVSCYRRRNRDVSRDSGA